jgi:hypothetical protein
MTKCANCSNEAFFEYMVTSTFTIPYCSKHIPKFLGKGVAATRLVKIQQSAPKLSKKKAVVEETFVEESVVEEPIIEEALIEEPLIDEGELEVTEGE